MSGTRSRSVSISQAGDTAGPPLSPAQKKFNTLVKKIDKQRQSLAQWQEAIPLYQQRWQREFVPLQAHHYAASLEFVTFLDELALRVKLGKADRATLAEAICDLASGLMGGEHDEALKALYNRHSGSDFDEDEREENDMLKSIMEQTFGIELEDDLDMSSPDDVARRVHEKLRAEHAQQAERQAQAAPRKDKRTAAREQRQAEEAAQASRSVREVYRKLASALHPDRETDATARERKTQQMQRANDAYQRGNLLDLLQLQLEIEQIDPAAGGVAGAVGDERLKHYNKVLKEQLDELQQAVMDIEQEFKMAFGIDPFVPLAPKTLQRHLREEIFLIEQASLQLRQQCRMLADPKALKSWLKDYRRHNQAAGFDDEVLAEMLFR